MTRSCNMAGQSCNMAGQRQHNTAIVSESDSSLTAKCLDICQTLATKGLAFSFSLKIGSTYTFSLESRKMDVPKQTRKKPSPSTQRRNALRRQKFLESKEAENVSKSHSDVETEVAVASSAATENFNCDACDFIGESNISLRIHKSRIHKTIPQLDGADSVTRFDAKRISVTDFYWERREFSLLRTEQNYRDVLADIIVFSADDQEKDIEITKATQRRKDEFGDHWKSCWT